MIKIIIVREITKRNIDQIVEIEGHHTEVEVSKDNIIEKDHIMSIIIEMTLEGTVLEKYEISEVKFLGVDTEGDIEMKILDVVKVGLGTHNIQIISEGITEVVVVGLDQVQEQVLIKTELML